MADTLPLNFPIPAENSVISYNYFDYVTGRGYKNFYCQITSNNGGNTYSLITTQDASAYGNRFLVSVSQDTYVTQSFDTTFLVPMKVEGNALISYTLSSGTGAGSTGNAKFEFYHVRGVTETAIGSVTGASTTLSSANNFHRLATLATLTAKDFAIGDILRVKVSVQHTATNIMRLYCDPASLYNPGEADTTGNPTIPTSLIISIPFRIQS